MKILVFAFATACAGALIYTTVFVSGDVVSYLMKQKKSELICITSSMLFISAVFLAIAAYRRYTVVKDEVQL